MQVDLLQGLRYERRLRAGAGAGLVAAGRADRVRGEMGLRPRILVFDSGLGGLTVQREVARERADADMLYVADDAAFPYGRLSEEALVARVEAVMARLVADFAPDVAVIACNTASTLVLGPLRARWPGIAFVGTVPAVKPAAAASRSGLISVLATPGTVSRDYTRRLIDEYAAHCEVTLVGSTRLASLAEAHMRGEAAPDADIAAEIAPCFVERAGRRTDAVALACTHYPLLLARLTALAPWPVAWIDPAPAIARRVAHVLAQADLSPRREDDGPGARTARFTSGRAPEPALAAFLEGLGLAGQTAEPLPLA